MSEATLSWLEANQRHLMAAVARVRAALERHAAAGEGPVQGGGSPEPAPAALEGVSFAFGLSAFERDVLILCAAVELDGTFAGLCAAAQGDATRPYPTFGLALAALADPHWSAIVPGAPLRRWRLLEVAPGATLTSSALRIDERVLHHLAGVDHLDERLEGVVNAVTAAGELPPSHAAAAARLAGHWSPRADSPWPVVELCGDDPSALRSVAAAAAGAALGARLFSLPAAAIPAPLPEQGLLRTLWEREAALTGSVLLVEARSSDPTDPTRAAAVAGFVDGLRAPVTIAAREPLGGLARPVVRLDVGRPTASEQRTVWTGELGPLAHRLNGQVGVLVSQFDLGADTIRATVAQALDGADPGDRADGLPARLWDACRSQARARLDDLAQRVPPAAAWDDLVLPAGARQLLRGIAVHARRRSVVYDDWGFSGKGGRGLGISALFAGASGTGKTMAAEVLAGELRLDLYRIDLSSVISKYIGETEKNLRRVFDAAEQGGAILFFDEADALFGKRSEVKDSHDRYANIEVGYLLQRMEAYRGLAILATNLKSALDPAFLRRIRFVVQFPFPDAAQRAEIWRRVFPATTPTEGLEPELLARLNLAGGSIRNIAVGAAFLAADEGRPVGMGHLLAAARTEYAKLEKPLTATEIGGWPVPAGASP